MSRIGPRRPGSAPSDRAVVADVLLREEPDEEDEPEDKGDDDDDNDHDNEDDEGYSE
jgi:hypothetical protein